MGCSVLFSVDDYEGSAGVPPEGGASSDAGALPDVADDVRRRRPFRCGPTTCSPNAESCCLACFMPGCSVLDEGNRCVFADPTLGTCTDQAFCTSADDCIGSDAGPVCCDTTYQHPTAGIVYLLECRPADCPTKHMCNPDAPSPCPPGESCLPSLKWLDLFECRPP